MGLCKKWDWRVNFFPKKNNPTPNHITQPPKMANLLSYNAPPPWLFWQYLSQKLSYKTGAWTQLGTRIRGILLSRAVAHLPRSQQHRHPFDRPLFFSIVPSSSRKLMMMVWLYYSTIIQFWVTNAGEAVEELEAWGGTLAGRNGRN